MAQALAVRASSFGAAFCLLSAMVVLALTATYRITQAPPIASLPPVVLMTPPEPTPPTPPKPAQPTASAEPLNIGPIASVATLADPPAASGTGIAPVLAEITRPTWARVPHDLDRFYPRTAMRQSIEGRAVLDCLVSTTGTLACAVVSEAPAGLGFGAAALQIASAYRMLPATRDGAAVEGRYRMVVPFHLR